MTADWPFHEPLVQPNRVSCGATVLVVARALLDREYGERVGASPWVPARFREEVLTTHRDVTAAVQDGRLQVPWPRALGTPPWALTRELGGRDVRWIRTTTAAGYDAVGAAARAGEPVPVYLGSRWLPRHVVLAVGEAEGRLRCFDPAQGRLVAVGREDFTGHRISVAGWDHPWWALLPAATHRAPSP
jgi:hypothetical protein